MAKTVSVQWYARYQCGCSADAPVKRDLLNYCGKHGSERVELFKMPRPKKSQAHIKAQRAQWSNNFSLGRKRSPSSSRRG